MELRCQGNRISVGFFFNSVSTENLSHRLQEPTGGGVVIFLLLTSLCYGDSEGPPTLTRLPSSAACQRVSCVVLNKHPPQSTSFRKGVHLKTLQDFTPAPPQSTQGSKLRQSCLEWGTLRHPTKPRLTRHSPASHPKNDGDKILLKHARGKNPTCDLRWAVWGDTARGLLRLQGLVRIRRPSPPILCKVLLTPLTPSPPPRNRREN